MAPPIPMRHPVAEVARGPAEPDHAAKGCPACRRPGLDGTVPCWPRDPSRDCRLIAAGRFWAVRVGLTGEEVHDCPMGFYRHIEETTGCPLRTQADRRTLAWVHQCAAHYALNYRRALTRRRHHEYLLSEVAPGERGVAPWNPTTRPPSLLHLLLRQELKEIVAAALDRLSRERRELLLRHHLLGESLQELADGSSKTYDAVRMMVKRAERAMRDGLLAEGVTEADLREYLLPGEEPGRPWV